MAKEGETLWDRVASQMAGGVVQAETPESPEEVEGPPAGAPSLPGDQLQSQTRQFYDVGIKALQLAAAGGLPQFAQDRVTIRDKSGSLRPFMFNRAQIFAHEMAERQLAERGYVRVIVLKGRQMGLSTYILCRGLFKVTRKTGQKAYILTHEIPATLNLFNIVKGMYDRIDPRLKPQAGRSNKQEMEFPGLSSGYSVGTAKSGETGRSLTVQFFHGSECAFWAAAKQIVPGLMQTIGLVPGTEIWLESTANGPSNYFASAVQAARKGATEFELCFVPWHWDPMYARSDILCRPGRGCPQTPPARAPQPSHTSGPSAKARSTARTPSRPSSQPARPRQSSSMARWRSTRARFPCPGRGRSSASARERSASPRPRRRTRSRGRTAR